MSAWPSASLVAVRDTGVEGQGRGLYLAGESVDAGAPLLCEAALVSHTLQGAPINRPWLLAAQLVEELLEVRTTAGAELATLEPRAAADAVAPNDEADELNAAVDQLRQCTSAQAVSDAELKRLLLVVARNAMALEGCQALCPRASMINHSCSPNATHQGFRRASDKTLCVCIRAVRNIQEGEQITISYVDDLATSVRERTASLAHHGFEAEHRPCDAALEGWILPAAETVRRAEVERTVHAHNVAADEAWSAAHASGAGDEQMKQQLMRAASLYAKLLQLSSGALDDRHAILLQARSRLAEVMMMSGADRSRANALPLWRAVLAALRPCVPEHWPQLLPPLRSAAAAAAAAGDESAASAFRSEYESVLGVLNPTCPDVGFVKP